MIHLRGTLQSCRNSTRLQHQESGCNASLCDITEDILLLILIHVLQPETPTSENGGKISPVKALSKVRGTRLYVPLPEPCGSWRRAPTTVIFLSLTQNLRCVQGRFHAREFGTHRRQNGFVNLLKSLFFYQVMSTAHPLDTYSSPSPPPITSQQTFPLQFL